MTHFELVERCPAHTLLEVTLETGRTHQIRVHLEAIDLPIAGDPVYGVPGDLGLERQFLHAARLAFAHPFTGERIETESPLPDDLAAALERARSLDAAKLVTDCYEAFATLGASSSCSPAWTQTSGGAAS